MLNVTDKSVVWRESWELEWAWNGKDRLNMQIEAFDWKVHAVLCGLKLPEKNAEEKEIVSVMLSW